MDNTYIDENLDKMEMIDYIKNTNDDKKLRILNTVVEYFRFICKENVDIFKSKIPFVCEKW